MELGNTFIDWTLIFATKDTSYKLYRKLSPEEAELIDAAGFVSNTKLLIMKIHREYPDIPLKKLIRKYLKVLESYQVWLPTRGVPMPPLTKDAQIAREFQFRGFVPDTEFPSCHKDKRFCYIMSNRVIENTIWVYPMKFKLSYNQIEKDLKRGKDISERYIYPNFEALAIQGHTKIQYCDL